MKLSLQTFRNNKLALGLRAFLPLVFLGSFLLLAWVWDTFVYGGYSNIVASYYHERLSYRISSLFVPFSYVAFPLFLVIHYVLSWVTWCVSISFKRVCLALGVMAVVLAFPYWALSDINAHVFWIGCAELFFKFGIPTLLYFYLLNATRLAYRYDDVNMFNGVWTAVFGVFLTVMVLLTAWKVASPDSELSTAGFWLYPLANYAWFGLIWVCPYRFWRWVEFLTGGVHVFFLLALIMNFL